MSAPKPLEVTVYANDIRKLYIAGDEERNDGIYVEYRGQRHGKGPIRWAVTRGGECLRRDGVWEWEPQPSSREDAWLTLVRWDSFGEALVAASAAARKEGRG